MAYEPAQALLPVVLQPLKNTLRQWPVDKESLCAGPGPQLFLLGGRGGVEGEEVRGEWVCVLELSFPTCADAYNEALLRPWTWAENWLKSASQRKATNLNFSATFGKTRERLTALGPSIAGSRESIQAQDFCHKRAQEAWRSCTHRSAITSGLVSLPKSGRTARGGCCFKYKDRNVNLQGQG